MFPLALVAALVLALRQEDIKLRRRARRYRQLELEGIEQLRRDPFPEERAVAGGFLREPDGAAAAGDDILRDELRRARQHIGQEKGGDMPAVIDSSPSCVVSNEAAEPADDSADFILQANFEDCPGFMTFGPGSTYGEEGTAADTLYYILTVLGIVVTLAVLVAWVVYENRQLVRPRGEVQGPRARPVAGRPGAPGTRRRGGLSNDR